MAKVVGIGSDTKSGSTPSMTQLAAPARFCSRLPTKLAHGITVYGQEMDNATWSLARMNMILHGHPTAVLCHGNTLAAPCFKNPDNSLKTFRLRRRQSPLLRQRPGPPDSIRPTHEHHRFEYGVPPTKNGDYAFLLHLITRR